MKSLLKIFAFVLISVANVLSIKRGGINGIFLSLQKSSENGRIRFYLEQCSIQLFSKVLIVQCVGGTDFLIKFSY